jgi:serine protease AprX
MQEHVLIALAIIGAASGYVASQLHGYSRIAGAVSGTLMGPLLMLRGAKVAVGLVLLSFVAATPVFAAGHRARMSADLDDQLAAGSSSIDVIVHGTRAEVDALAQRYNVRVKRYMKSGVVFQVTAGQLAALQQDETLDHLSADVPIHSIADVTAQTIGADQVWAGSERLPPLSGQGVGVALIDSGVDTRHEALSNRVVFTKDFKGGNGFDGYGHGTHVAGIISGGPGQTSDTADYRGIASGARIINLRVLGDDGSGVASDVIEAIDWAIENRRVYDIRVINLSLGAPVTQPYRDDPLCEAVERAVAAGIVVVAAAGNYGQAAEGRMVVGGIASPGNDPGAITVGALDTHGTPVRSDDTVAAYSSRGPTRYDLVLKPDLVAPGSHVVSAESAGSYLARTYPQRHVAGTGTNGYIQLSGTSMAAGVVSGAVALLLEENPRLTPRNAKAVLQMTSSFMPREGLLASGAGSLNVIAAAELAGPEAKFSLLVTTIAGEQVSPGGFAFFEPKNSLTIRSFSERKARRRPQALARSATIIWGTDADEPIIWGTTIMAAMNVGDTIIWGTDASDTIIWGTNTDDTIIWGTNASDTIIWGTIADDTIIWGTSFGDGVLD